MQLPPNMTAHADFERNELPDCFWQVWDAIVSDHGAQLACVLKACPESHASEQPRAEEPPAPEFWEALASIHAQHGEQIRGMMRRGARRFRIDASVAARSAEASVTRAVLRHGHSPNNPPWRLLCTIVRRKLRDYACTAQAQKRDARRDRGDGALPVHADSRTTAPEDHAAIRLLLVDLFADLGTLQGQKILVLRWFRFNKDEIGTILDISQYQIRIALKAAREWCNRRGLSGLSV
jgi:DNA-directed RNA polymerase specialized sigma24 family protein